MSLRGSYTNYRNSTTRIRLTGPIWLFPLGRVALKKEYGYGNVVDWTEMHGAFKSMTLKDSLPESMLFICAVVLFVIFLY